LKVQSKKKKHDGNLKKRGDITGDGQHPSWLHGARVIEPCCNANLVGLKVVALVACTITGGREARRIRDYGDHFVFLTPGNTVDADIVAIADRLAREGGWPEEPEATREKRPGGWSLGSLQAARTIGALADGPWRAYIEAKSGRPLQLFAICHEVDYSLPCFVRD